MRANMAKHKGQTVVWIRGQQYCEVVTLRLVTKKGRALIQRADGKDRVVNVEELREIAQVNRAKGA